MSQAEPSVGRRRKCRRCGLRYEQHIIDEKCADGQKFWASPKRRTAASNSFTIDEIAIALQLTKNATLGYDSRILTRRTAFASLMRKFDAMNRRVTEPEEA